MNNSDNVVTNILINEISHVDIVKDKARKAKSHQVYYENNKDSLAEYGKSYYQLNKEKVKEANLVYLETVFRAQRDTPEFLKMRREYHKALYNKKKERMLNA